MMSPNNNDKMDEEKSFEVIQEGVPKQFENEPHLVRKGLTEVSAMFDRNGKGYLDDTERALRRMDSQDRGYLGIDKVCVIFESLQAEQERSSELLEALRTESKKSLNLKMAVIALSAFSILLALANVGTSFAVATMVKDTQVSHGDLLAKDTGFRVGTTSKLAILEMNSIEDEGRRRHLQATAGLICEQNAETVNAANGLNNYTEKECALQGTIDMSVADALHQQLTEQDRVVLTCNLQQSVINGVLALPTGTPGTFTMGSGDYTVDYKMYPTTNPDQKYDAVQRVFVPASNSNQGSSSSISRVGRSHFCDAEFELGIYCPVELKNGKQQECLVMTAYEPTLGCPTLPIICGPKNEPFSFIN